MDPTPLQRALQAAPERASAVLVAPEQEFFCFRLGELRLGVPSGLVREVVRAGPLTPLPRTPAYLMGVTGHRGEVLPVIDLLRFLGKGEARILPRTRLFVAVAGNCIAAVVADSVAGLKKIPVAEILPPPVGGDVSHEHLLGVVEEPRSSQTLSLLRFDKLLQSARQRAVAR